MILCSRCGNPVGENEKYCSCCGFTVAQNSIRESDSSEPEPADVFVFSEQADISDEPRVLSGSPAVADKTGALCEPPAVSDETGAVSEQVILPDQAPIQPIWVIRSKEQPLDEILDDSFLDEPGGETSFSRPDSRDYPARFDSSGNDKVDEDIFDEIYDASSQIYSNMPPKLKKVIIVTLVSTLLSIIPLIYAACSHQPEPAIDSYIQMPTVTASTAN